jgi:hypothetical protein
MMIINDDSRVSNKLKASLTEDARVVIYDCHMFIVRATGIIKRVSWFKSSLLLRIQSDSFTNINS